jgi:trk/ktr system potassium uptake protein
VTSIARLRGPRTPSWSTRLSPTLYPVALALVGAGAIGLISGAVALGEDLDQAATLISLGGGFSVAAAAILRIVPRPELRRAPIVFSMATLWFLTLMTCAAVMHLITSSVDSLDVAIFESMAAATTTAMTTLEPEGLDKGVLLYRAGTQWVAGAGALLLAIVVVPLVSGAREPGLVVSGNPLNPGGTGGVRRILRIYVGFSSAIFVAYIAAGMPSFDALAHMMTTVSTGGLSTRNDSIGAFDSAPIEWVAGIGSAIAGISLVAVWWVLSGDRRSIRRGAELKVYVGVLAIATSLLFLSFADDLGAGEAARAAFVTTASAMSTTGFVTIPWSVFGSGAQAMLLLLVGIGAMTGSAGGGFSYQRVILVLRSASRELGRQLHPASVQVVKVGGEVVDERRIERLHGFLITFIVTGAVGATAVALADQGVGTAAAIELTEAALVTGGPTVGEASSPTVADLGAVSHIALSVVMLLGRMAIYPVLLAVMTLARRMRETARDAHFTRKIR